MSLQFLPTQGPWQPRPKTTRCITSHGKFLRHILKTSMACSTSVVHSRCRDEFWRKLGPALYQQPIGTHLYVCGPAAMTEEVQTSARRAGWPTGRLHAEAFTGGIVTNGEPFIASLISSGKTIDVSANLSLLEALEQAGVKVPNMCRRGVCGECRLEVAAGIPDHHDFVLSEEEKAGSQFIMPCVSRARSEHLELKL